MKNIAIWQHSILIILIFFFCTAYMKNNAVTLDYLKQYVEKNDDGQAKKKLLFFLDILWPFYKEQKKLSIALIEDLDILQPAHSDFFTVLSRCIKPKTTAGEISLLLSFLHPTTNIEKLSEKQKFIQYLIENPNILSFCEEIISMVQQSEASLCTLLSEPTNSDNFNEFLFSIKHTQSHFIFTPLSLLGQPIFLWFCTALGGYFVSHPDFVHYFIELIQKPGLKNITHMSCGLGAISIMVLQTIMMYKQIQQYTQITNTLRDYFLQMYPFFKACLCLSTLVEKIPQLKHYEIFNFFDEIFQLDAQLNEVRLYTEKIKNSSGLPSILQSESLCTLYKKLDGTKEKISSLFHTLGELDLYISIAKMIRDNKNNKENNLPFCFAEFVETKTPFLEIKDNWNPLLLTHKNESELVPSDFILGNEQVNIAIVTGPNTSGKTAITTGFVFAILLSQSLGICPASKIILTPFKHIKILLPVRSSVPHGDSKFKTEMKEIIHLIKKLRIYNQKNEHVFAVLDEIFSGTDIETGILVAREFFNTLLKEKLHNQSLIILSTHYHELTKLAQENKQCQNCTLHVVRNQDGSIQRTFKLIPGTCPTLHLAIDLFKEEIKSVFG